MRNSFQSRRQAKTALKGHAKKLVNRLLVWVGKPEPFELSLMEKLASASVVGFPNKQFNTFRKWWVWGFQETLVGWSLLIFVVLSLIIQIFGADVGADNIWTEFWGLIFDVLVILVGFGVIQNWKYRREEVARQHELIEDFRRWDNEEARHRIMGAMRRLSKLGVTKVDLTGAILRDVCFVRNGVSNISGSQLSGDSWSDERYKTSVFDNVDFSRLDCREVQFERTPTINGHPFGPSADYKNCNFWDANLQLSTFDGAALLWDEPARDDMFETIAEEDDGRPVRQKVVADRFNEANLAYASFKGCNFKHADFRNAYCIELADFRGARGLDSCLFDDDETKQKVLANSREQL